MIYKEQLEENEGAKKTSAFHRDNPIELAPISTPDINDDWWSSLKQAYNEYIKPGF